MNYFKPQEFECNCGCGLNNISPTLVNMLNDARGLSGIPFVITSGSRCASYNKKSGGLASSAHLSGLGVDIRAESSRERFKVLDALITCGFNRIGIAKSFIHVDIDPSKPLQVAWIYQ